MITNTGKNIIAKYLLGHTSSYASHIAIGCGATPLGQFDDPLFFADLYESKDNLDFEMFRVPVTSRGYVKEDGLTYVVFTAELPTTERYGITEVGIYSAGSNPEAGIADSKLLRSFSDLENWEYHTQSGVSEILRISESLDNGTNVIFPLDEEGEETGYPAFRASSDNPTFLYEDRISRHEVPRFLDSSIIVRGDTANIAINNEGSLVPDDSTSAHIHLTGTSFTLDQNAPTDELKFAFSLINREGEDPEDEYQSINDPEEIRIVLEFASNEGGDSQSAFLEINLVDGENGIDFGQNRYFVITKQLQDLRSTIGFSWSQVNIIKAYVSVLEGVESEPSSNYFIALDGLRLENKTDRHPLYGLTGYSVIKNNEAYPVIKESNSSNFAEFRFGFELDQYSMQES
jgi:hypothetical protein